MKTKIDSLLVVAMAFPSSCVPFESGKLVDAFWFVVKTSGVTVGAGFATVGLLVVVMTTRNMPANNG